MKRLPGQPIDIVEHVTTLILMEEQVNETLFKSIKHVIWSKISRFIQVKIIIKLYTMRLPQVCTPGNPFNNKSIESGRAELSVGAQ